MNKEVIMSKLNNIQSLLIKYLMEKGQINLLLPDGVELEIGVMKESKRGKWTNCIDDYCYVEVSKEGKNFLMDSYNMGLQFVKNSDTMVFQDESIRDDGKLIQRIDVI